MIGIFAYTDHHASDHAGDRAAFVHAQVGSSRAVRNSRRRHSVKIAGDSMTTRYGGSPEQKSDRQRQILGGDERRERDATRGG
jgi:hypothetical protein